MKPTMLIADLPFEFVGPVQPERDATGSISKFMPQADYRNTENHQLHRYGFGPFCKFRLRTGSDEGVYAFVVDREVVYIGECEDLSSRLNNGYGNISPRNCYEGGQPTNCRVNSLVLQHSTNGQSITIWFHATANRKAVEAQLLQALRPPWNRAGVARPNARGVPTPIAPSSSPSVSEQSSPAQVLITSPSVVQTSSPGQIRTRSRVESPVRLVWNIADQMVRAKPAVSRREIIDECIRRGVAPNTAKTQYSAWNSQRRG